MFFVRIGICLALVLGALTLLQTMIEKSIGQGGAVVFMMFTVGLITLTLRMPLPAPSKEAQTDQPHSTRIQ